MLYPICYSSSRQAVGSLMFQNITQEQLDMKFYCMPWKFRHMKVEFGFKDDCEIKIGEQKRFYKATCANLAYWQCG